MHIIKNMIVSGSVFHYPCGEEDVLSKDRVSEQLDSVVEEIESVDVQVLQ